MRSGDAGRLTKNRFGALVPQAGVSMMQISPFNKNGMGSEVTAPMYCPK